MEKPVKAYRTRLNGVDCVVFARSRGAARHATVMAARDAGYKVGYADVSKCNRDKDLDCRKGSRPVGRCYKPDEFVSALNL